MRRKYVIWICLLLLLIILGRLGYHIVRPGNHPKAAPGSSYVPSSTATQATNKVTIHSYAFLPADIKIKAGVAVIWTNQDLTGYTITEDDGQSGPSSEMITQGQTFTYKFAKVGLFHYHDSLNPTVSGTVTVQ